MEKQTLHTVLSPALLDLYNLENTVVVIIDVFRATSTIAAALCHGAQKVIPVADVDECKRIGKELNAITAGERNGHIIEGLLHGNSPLEYSSDFIKDKTLVLTTTNGTKMLHMAVKKGAEEIVTGSFPNLTSVCNHLLRVPKNIILACSAWKDIVNIEDTLFAGAVIDTIGKNYNIHCDSSLMAQQLYTSHKNDLSKFVQRTTHWHRLARYGLEKDMLFCISKDAANVLPVYDKKDNNLTIKKAYNIFA